MTNNMWTLPTADSTWLGINGNQIGASIMTRPEKTASGNVHSWHWLGRSRHEVRLPSHRRRKHHKGNNYYYEPAHP